MLALPSMKSFTDSVPLPLVCHPQTPSRAIRGIDVVVGGSASGILTLAFALEGDLSGLRIPEPRASRRGHGLWQHTCFEVFVMAEEGPGYREFNFSPSGEWAVYAFRGYRDGGELEIDTGPGNRGAPERGSTGAGCGDLVRIFCRRAVRCGWGCPRLWKMRTACCLTGRCDILRANPTSIILMPLRCNWHGPNA